MSRGDILPLVHFVYCNYYNYFIFNCHLKFKGMQCNVYVYRIHKIKKYFTCYFCRYFRFSLNNVGKGHAKKRQNVTFTMFNLFPLIPACTGRPGLPLLPACTDRPGLPLSAPVNGLDDDSHRRSPSHYQSSTHKTMTLI